MTSKKWLGGVGAFRSEMKLLTLGAFATIFTWGFVQALKKTVLTPVIQSYLIPSETDGMNVPLRGNRYMDMGGFVAELIEWSIFMIVIFIIWQLGRYRNRHQSDIPSTGHPVSKYPRT